MSSSDQATFEADESRLEEKCEVRIRHFTFEWSQTVAIGIVWFVSLAMVIIAALVGASGKDIAWSSVFIAACATLCTRRITTGASFW